MKILLVYDITAVDPQTDKVVSGHTAHNDVFEILTSKKYGYVDALPFDDDKSKEFVLPNTTLAHMNKEDCLSSLRDLDKACEEATIKAGNRWRVQVTKKLGLVISGSYCGNTRKKIAK